MSRVFRHFGLDSAIRGRRVRQPSCVQFNDRYRAAKRRLLNHEPLESRLLLVGNVNVSLGDFDDGVDINFQYEATVNTSVPKGVDRVYDQGTVSGSNFTTILTDDPAIPDPKTDPTETPLDRAPQVTDVFVRGSGVTGWDPTFLAYLASNGLGDATFGLRIPDGASQAAIVPHVNINEFSARFSEPVIVGPADLELHGVTDTDYALDASGFNYDVPTNTATWRLDSSNPFILNDKVRMVVLDASGVTDAAGNQQLDGNWNDNASFFPSGDGVAGGNFSFLMNFVPGDGNQSGATTVTDLVNIGSNVGKTTVTVSYSHLFDVNGSGGITVTDLVNAGSRVVSTVPATNPGGSPNPGWVAEQTATVPAPGAAATQGTTATDEDFLVIDVDGDGVADPGDTLLYDINIKNNSGGTAQSIIYDDTLEPNLTLGLRGPAAIPDSYTTAEGVTLIEPAVSGLSSNDFDIDGVTASSGLVVSSITPVGTPQGSITSFGADGSFTYVPPATGFGFTDSFEYVTVDTDSLVGRGIVKIDVVSAANAAPFVSSFTANNVGNAEAGNTSYSFDVEYSDDSAIDFSSIDTNDVTVTGPGGLLTVTSATPSPGANASPLTGMYTITPPGGTWDAGDNGTYTVGVLGSQIGDDGSPQLFVPANPTLTTFQVNITPNAAPFVSSFTSPNVGDPEAGNTSYNFDVEYSDDSAIDFSTIDTSDVTVTGPGGPLTVTSATPSPGSNVSPLTGMYTVTPPGGDWDAGDNGTYTIGVVGNQIGDDGAPQLFVPANPTLTTFQVSITPGVPPSAVGDGPFDVIGNVGIDVPAGSGVLGNDSLGTPAATISAFDATSLNGGDVTVNTSTGAFTYTPAAGYTGTDLFDYTIMNASGSSTATVSLTVTDMIWFIDATAGGGGDGRLDSPFNCLVGAGCFDPAASDAAGDSIFLADGSYTGGITLLNNQLLIGDGSSSDLETVTGITLPSFSNSLPTFSGTDPTITAVNTNGIGLAQGNTIRGLTIGNTGTGTGIVGTAFGTLTVSETTVNGTGQAIDLDTGTLAVTFDSVTSTSSAGDGIDISSVTGTFDVTGTTTISNPANNGIDITGSSGTFTFNDLDIDTTSGIGFNATSGGTVNVASPGTTSVDTGTGTAVNLVNVATTTGITFDSVNKNGSGDGILLDGVSGSGTFTVTGGTIQNTTGRGFDTNNVSINVDVGASISNNGATGANNRTVEMITYSGTATFSGAIDENRNGVNILSSPSGTFSFTGGLDIDTTTSAGFSAVGGGTLNVTGSSNTVNTTIGKAVNLNDTTIGASGVTLQSITTTAAGGNEGITLENTGTGTFTVTGTGSTAGSGGTISNKTVDAITLRNTDGLVTFNNMIIQDIGDNAGAFDTRSGDDGIHGQQVDGGLSLDNTTIRRISDSAILGASLTDGVSATTWNGLTITDSTLEDSNRFHVAGVADASDEGLVRIVGLTGTVLVDNSTLQRGAELLDFTTTTGSVDITVQSSNFFDAYKEFTSGGVSSVGKMGIDVTIQGSADAVVRIGDPNETNATLGNSFRNNRLASIRVANDTGATGDIDAVVSRNTIIVNDHSSGIGGDFDFPMGGVKYQTRGTDSATFDGIISHNTLDEVTNADGGVGQVTLDFDEGQIQARISDNTFDTPGNAPWFARFDSTLSADILFDNNTGIQGFFSCPDPSCGGGYNGPGLRSLVQAQNSANLDLTIQNDTFAPHDTGFDPGNTVEIHSLNVGGGGNINVDFDSNASPHGYGFREETGTITLFQGASAATGNCTTAAPANCITVMDDNNNTGGSGNAALTPPDVDIIVGTISITTTAPTVPSITIPLMAAGGPALNDGGVPSLVTSQLDVITAEATARWAATGLAQDQVDLLNSIAFSVQDLADGQLAATFAGAVRIDDDAAGYGWFVDSTPGDDEEFPVVTADTQSVALAGSEAAGRMDLLTVVLHELGHVLGYHHGAEHSLMGDTLETGIRRLPDGRDDHGTIVDELFQELERSQGGIELRLI